MKNIDIQIQIIKKELFLTFGALSLHTMLFFICFI